jgi:threonine synthase
MAFWRGVIEEYRSYLPVTDKTPVVTLKEGDTPLIFGPRVSEKLGNGLKLYFKFEGLNPTGSFKDRGMTLAMSKAVE